MVDMNVDTLFDRFEDALYVRSEQDCGHRSDAYIHGYLMGILKYGPIDMAFSIKHMEDRIREKQSKFTEDDLMSMGNPLDKS
jgi:hypothetical protein